jgi:hypothetical protein
MRISCVGLERDVKEISPHDPMKKKGESGLFTTRPLIIITFDNSCSYS